MPVRTHRLYAFGGSTLLALALFGTAVSAQDQSGQNQPAPQQPSQPQSPQAQPSQEQPSQAQPSQAQPSQPQPPQGQAPSAAPPQGSSSQERLPQITVHAPPKPSPQRAVQRTAPLPAPTAPSTPPVNPAAAKNERFDEARSNIFTTIGASSTSTTLSRDTIETLPQGANQTVEKVLLQTPGVSQDSAASGAFHVRNDHANVAFRINGVLLPDGVTGFGSFLDTAFIGNLSLVTGALPAEFGLRTVGIVDITTRADAFNNSGSVGFYGGSRGTIMPSFEYGGTFGNTCPKVAPGGSVPPWLADCFPGVQYFFSGRYLQTTEGIENPLPNLNAIHDFSQQERGFAYMSTFVDPATRVSLIAGTSTAAFQIPNTPGAGPNPIVSPAFATFDSKLLNENQWEQTQFAVLALQRSTPGFDGQISYFTRYTDLHFRPDLFGDLALNGIASDVSRKSYVNGIQADASYLLNPAHTLRAGFTVSGEKVWVDNTSYVEQCTLCDGSPLDSVPPNLIADDVSKLGWLAGVYVQDEWKITDKLTMNVGLRFDQMWQFVTANQLSPRVSFTYKPFENTTFHAGYARYFTPPVMVEAAPVNVALFTNTTGAPPGAGTDPVQPERAHYFDVGVEQKIPFKCSSSSPKDCPELDLGLDAYYKIARDLIDNGQFGAALVLSAFNYLHAYVEGIEFSAKYRNGGFQAYANLAVGEERATGVVSNEFLFDNVNPLADLGGLTRLQYLNSHWIYTDHTQIVTGSAGAAYQFCGRPSYRGEPWWASLCGTKISADMIYGSGLRQGDANIDTLPPYAQFNAGISHEFGMPDGKPLTVRFDVVNIFDSIYNIRSGSGIGVFAPQFGPRRGYYFGVSKKIGPGGEESKAQPSRAWEADMSPPAAAATNDWTGFYLGLNAGYASATVGQTIAGSVNASGSERLASGIGGAQIGANQQIGPWVLGFEADLDGSLANKSWAIGGIAAGTQEIPWIATLRARAGFAFDWLLLYVTAGGAATELRSNVTVGGGAVASTDRTHGAWTAGGGLEATLGGGLSARLEYLYVDTGTVNVAQLGGTPPPPFVNVTGRVQDNLVRGGLNYRLPTAW